MTEKDKKAFDRVNDCIKLQLDISNLIRKFSQKYDVECIGIDIRKNEWYNKDNEQQQPPMYLIDFAWKFDYLGHPIKNKKIN